ncbi:MAG: RibD family protein [Deltaproteobacteria bacterium]|nr:RibD family protein [Deltaproteobacteria bacterium]
MPRPVVRLNMAMTVDGKTASAAREAGRFTSAADLARMQELRADADAVLVGAETVRRIDPPLSVVDPALRQRRRDRGKSEHPMQLVLSASGDLPPTCRALSEPAAAPRVLVTGADPLRLLQPLANGVEHWRLGKGTVDLQELMGRLEARGVEVLLVEGGAETNGRFLDAALVDEVFVTLAPTLLGGRGAPSFAGGAGLALARRLPLTLAATSRLGDELFLHYRALHPDRPLAGGT